MWSSGDFSYVMEQISLAHIRSSKCFSLYIWVIIVAYVLQAWIEILLTIWYKLQIAITTCCLQFTEKLLCVIIRVRVKIQCKNWVLIYLMMVAGTWIWRVWKAAMYLSSKILTEGGVLLLLLVLLASSQSSGESCVCVLDRDVECIVRVRAS